MPSLRRTASSPVVRSVPYPSSSPTSNGVAVRGHGHRRSSGSDTTSRRVLADIEWWRVTDGQLDPSADQESEEHNTPDGVNPTVVDLFPEAVVAFASIDAGVRHPPASLSLIPVASALSFEAVHTAMPTEQFAALSITPHTPTRRHHSRQSSWSSLESTPEAPDSPGPATPVDLSGLDTIFFDTSLPSIHIQRRNRVVTAPALLRSYTLADCLSLKDDHASYADFAISPLSCSPKFFN